MTGLFESVEDELNELFDLFSPRYTWATPQMGYDSGRIDLMMVLWKLQKCGHLSVTYHKVPLQRFEGLAWRGDEYQIEMSRVADARRGKSDLKDETWSGYVYLQQKCQDERLEGFSWGLPFAYLSRSRSEAVTAGNVDPEAMLKWLVDHNVRCLGIVGAYYGVDDGQSPFDVFGYENTGLVQISFTEQGLSGLKNHLVKRDAARQAEIRKALSRAHERMDPRLLAIIDEASSRLEK